MKQLNTWMFAAILSLSGGTLCAQTQKEQVNAYFTTKEMPRLSIAPPPNDTASARFRYDLTALAENKDAIGLRNCAKTAAVKAVRLYPADNPDVFEDIEDLL